MELFTREPRPNLLPYNGEVVYYGEILNAHDAGVYMQELLHDVPWRHDEARLYGKHFITERKVAWYADENYSYTYSGVTRHAHVFTPLLKHLQQLVQGCTGARYNACLLNLYGNGSQGMAYHSDDEKSMVANASIASLTLGSQRRFLFKHKQTGLVVETSLAPGSLLEMKGETQQYWRHRLPTTTRPTGARINLTFRQMVSQ